MDQTQATVPSHFVTTMLAIAAERNCDTQALLSSIGINPEDITNQQPISALLYGELHHHIIELVQDEWFGMLSGGPVPKGAIRLLCQSVVHCRSLEQALTRSAEFFEVCRGFKVKLALETEGDQVLIKVCKLDCISNEEFDALIAETHPNVIKSTLSAWHGFYSWLIGNVVPLDAIYYNFDNDHMASKPHKHSTSYHYNHAFIGQRFAKKYLDYPIVQNEDSVEDFMRKAPYYGLIKKHADEGLATYVKSLLAKTIGEEFPNATEVAEYFNMSVTTLHRRLGNEGVSFQSLKNESRMEAAIHYLNCPDISTATISDLLSFENPSTFFRAFKKWTGMPPGEYRRQLMEKRGQLPVSEQEH